jgi:endoglucanase
MEKRALELMGKMMDAFGPSGFEREINRIVKEEVESIADEIITDKLGSVAFKLNGDGPKVLLAGHTNEVGFIISSITKEGFLTFNQLGGWWDQVLLAQKVIIRGRKGDVVGVIASKPPHILPMEERKKVVVKKDMFIDIGVSSKEEVEEVGIRGAQTMAQTVNPDVAIVLEVDIAGDVPGIKPHEAATKMGGGPGMITYDRSMIPNQDLKEFVLDIASKAQIPIQLSQMAGGGTDAGRIHVNSSGCPSIVLTVPTRHIHSHIGLLSIKDTENMIRLVVELLRKLDWDTVNGFSEL